MKIIYKFLSGSHMHGTATPKSDRDIRGIWLPTIEECLKFKQPEEIRELPNEDDVVIPPIQKFFMLALKGNPNIIDWLFAPEESILEMTEEGERIRDSRELFIGKHVGERIRQYAKAEFRGMYDVTGKTGAKRKAELKHYGYSPKMAMNAIRILQEGTELMETGHITLPVDNASILLKIKHGEFATYQIENGYNEAVKQFDKAFKASKLPDNPDYEGAEKLMINLIVGDEIYKKMLHPSLT